MADSDTSPAPMLAQFHLVTNDRPLRLILDLPGGHRTDLLLPQRAFCQEAICGRLELRILCVSENVRETLKGFIGVPAELQIVTDRGQLRRICGIVTEAASGQSDGGLATYQLTIRDALSVMGSRINTRVFRDKNELDVIKVLIDEMRTDNPVLAATFDLHIDIGLAHRKLPPRDFIMQHNESDADFIRRLLQRHGIRSITGEPLHPPCAADLRGSQIDGDKIPSSSRLAQAAPQDRGPAEEVDPITAAIAVTAAGSMKVLLEELLPAVASACPGDRTGKLSKLDCERMQAVYNAARHPGKESPDDDCVIVSAGRRNDGTVMAYVMESPNDARRRWQHELGEKSFHSAIFDSRVNHRQVTAYDVAIGSGKAASDPLFYAYLCAVADWRLKNPAPGDKVRPEMPKWSRFLQQFGTFYECEPDWRKDIIEGNVKYYSTGVLPSCLPVLTGRLWDIVISETMRGKRVNQPAAPKGKS